MDQILIKDLTLQCIIGTRERERIQLQPVVINIDLTTDVSVPAWSDKLDDAVNYQSLVNRITSMVEVSSFNLIETLAEKIAAICIEFKGVEKVKVTVGKPQALKNARIVAVEITRY